MSAANVPSPPWDPLIPVLVELLSSAIANWEQGNGVLTRAVHTLPVLCKDARDHARLQPTAPWLLLFQLHVYKFGIRAHYYDAIPSSIDFDIGEHKDDWLKPGCTPPRWRDTHKQNIELARLLQIRIRVAALLSTETGADCISHLDNGFIGHAGRFLATEGIPEGLPLPVRQFVGFMRFLNVITTGTLAVYYAPGDLGVLLDSQCSRKGCTRGASAWVNDPRTHAVDCTLQYWERCRTGRSPENLEDATWSPFAECNLNFCSQLCGRQTMHEFDRLVRCCSGNARLLNTVDFVRLPRVAQAGASSRTRGQRQLEAACLDAIPPNRLHRAAIERNEKMRRRIAEVNSAHVTPVHLPIDQHAAAALRQELVMALNVDTALLYAASVIGELPASRRPNKTLPHCLAWRKQRGAEVAYLNAILAIRNLYLTELTANPTQPARLLTSPSDQPRWLQKVKDRILTLF